MREHPVDDLAVVLLALPLGPFVHDRREGGAESVRDMMAVIARPVEAATERILAHRLVGEPVVGEDQRTAPVSGQSARITATACGVSGTR